MIITEQEIINLTRISSNGANSRLMSYDELARMKEAMKNIVNQSSVYDNVYQQANKQQKTSNASSAPLEEANNATQFKIR